MKLDDTKLFVVQRPDGTLFMETKSAGRRRVAVYNSEASANRAIASRRERRQVFDEGFDPSVKYPGYVSDYRTNPDWQAAYKKWNDNEKLRHWVKIAKEDYKIIAVRITVDKQ